MIVVLVCILVRLVFFMTVRPWEPEAESSILLQNDQLGYHQLATTIINHHRYANSDTATLNTKRTPLYPLFISVNYWLFGERPWVIVLSNILINSLTCLLLLIIISRIFEYPIAITASLIFALDPNNIMFSNLLYSEILFVFLLVVGLYLFCTALWSSSPVKTTWSYILCAISFGLATLVRPISLYLPIIIITFFLVWYRHHIVKGIKYSAVFILFFLLTISPWLLRNYNLYGSFSLSSVDSEVLLLYNVAYIEMTKRNQDIGTVRDALKTEAEEMMIADGLSSVTANRFQQAKYWNQLVIEYIKADPVGYGKHYCLGIFSILSNLGTSMFSKMLRCPSAKIDMRSYNNIYDLMKDFFRRKGVVHLLIAGVIVMFLTISYLSFVIGLKTAWSGHHKGILIFCLLLTVYFLLIGALTAYARFRLPPTPFALPFIGAGFHLLLKKSKIIR